MITIIKDNYRPVVDDVQLTANPKRTFERACRVCRSVFRYDENDLLEEDRGLFGPYTFIECPCCKAELPHYGSMIGKEITEVVETDRAIAEK